VLRWITVSCSLTNTGSMHGAETVQIYVQAQPEKELSHIPNYQLKGLQKVALQPGESKKVQIHLPPKAFALYDEKGQCVVNAGKCRIYVGTHGPDNRSRELTGSECVCLQVSTEEMILE